MKDRRLDDLRESWSALTEQQRNDIYWMIMLDAIVSNYNRRGTFTANRRWLHVKDAVVVGGLEPRIIG